MKGKAKKPPPGKNPFVPYGKTKKK